MSAHIAVKIHKYYEGDVVGQDCEYVALSDYEQVVKERDLYEKDNVRYAIENKNLKAALRKIASMDSDDAEHFASNTANDALEDLISDDTV